MANGELLPTDGLRELTWSPPIERQSGLETRSGFGQTLLLGRPFWRLRASYVFQNDLKYRLMTAFLARRQGARYTFLAPRISRRAPALAPSLTNAGLGVASVDIANGTVTFTGVGTTVITPGDMCGFYTAALGYWVGEATAVATPTGGVVTIPVHPYPQNHHLTTPNARLKEALGEFKLSGVPNTSETYDGKRAISFEAIQYVRQ